MHLPRIQPLHNPGLVTRPRLIPVLALNAILLGFATPLAHAALPVMPLGDNTENIVFQDDFSNGNLKGWSNIDASGVFTTGKATIGSDPNGSGATVWYPSVNSDGTTVTSTITLPSPAFWPDTTATSGLNVADGPVAIYMRVRLDTRTGGYNNGFAIKLTEKTPNTRYGEFQFLPGARSFVGYVNFSTQVGVYDFLDTYTFPSDPGTFVNLRMVFTHNGNGSMDIKTYRYDAATSTYVSMSVNGLATADINTGIFDQLKIYTYNRTGGANRAYFDSVMVTQVGSPRASYPNNAYLMPSPPLTGGVTLQSALDANQVVVLRPANYSAEAPFVLRSGQKLYGDQAYFNQAPMSKIPSVTIEAGATGAVLSNVVATGGVTFPASASVTSGCVFDHLNGAVTAVGATLKDNLFLHINGTINIDTTNGGYLRNNRFIRTKSHASSNQLVMMGDANRNSYGNVFLWKNFLTPGGVSTNINNQADLTVVGVDAESWNYNGTGNGAPLWKIGRMGTFRVFGMNGGNGARHSKVDDGKGPDGVAGTSDDHVFPYDNRTGDFDVDADEFQLYNDTMSVSPVSDVTNQQITDYKLGAYNLRSLLVAGTTGKKWTNANTGGPFRAKAFAASTTDLANTTDFSTSTTTTATPSWTAYTTAALPAAQKTALQSMVVNPVRIAGQVAWESPKHNSIPDPAGPNWAVNRASQPSSSATLQGWINGGIKIPSGIYYIDQPLKIKRDQSIIGSGADNTVIIAKTATFDMVVADDTGVPSQATARSITIADITFQGGKNGIHFEPVGTGTTDAAGNPIWTGRYDGSAPPKQYVSRAQYTACHISHVTFRDMQGSAQGTDGAGIFMDQIYALDNIFFGYVHFVNCDTGLKQKCDPAYVSGDVADDPTAARMMYMDKCVFYKCQFVNNRLALDLPGKRACNLDAWINCLFQQNTGGAAALTAYNTPLFANCDFINNGGTVAKSNLTVNHVGNAFVAGAGTAMLEGPVSAEGCTFDRWGSATAKILSGNNSRVFLSNCYTGNMPLNLPVGAGANGVLINSPLSSGDAALSKQVVLIKAGAIYPLIDVAASLTNPWSSTQLLFGGNWSSSTQPIKDY